MLACENGWLPVYAGLAPAACHASSLWDWPQRRRKPRREIDCRFVSV